MCELFGDQRNRPGTDGACRTRSEEPRISDEAIKKMATKEEKEAAHQKNRRTDFKVLSYDYVPQAN